MLRINVTNDPAERWTPVIARHFTMTLAPHETTIRSLTVQLVAPAPKDASPAYACELHGRGANGFELRIRSSHEDGDMAIAHAFARARRELRRGRLRARMVS
ncbi:MAG: hypothetical protein RIC56_07680 [Pseudomonadales bacterium]